MVEPLYNPTHYIAQAAAHLTEEPEVPYSIPSPGHTSVETYHEIFSAAIFPLPIIQEGQLSVSGNSMGI